MIYSGCSIFWLWRMWCLIVWRGNAALVGQEAALHHSSSVVKAAGNCISHLHQPWLQLHQDSDCVTCVFTELGNTSINNIPNLCKCIQRTQSSAINQSDCKILIVSSLACNGITPGPQANSSHLRNSPGSSLEATGQGSEISLSNQSETANREEIQNQDISVTQKLVSIIHANIFTMAPVGPIMAVVVKLHWNLTFDMPSAVCIATVGIISTKPQNNLVFSRSARNS